MGASESSGGGGVPFQAIKYGKVTKCKKIIRKCKNSIGLNLRDSEGYTMLALATLYNRVPVLTELLANGAGNLSTDFTFFVLDNKNSQNRQLSVVCLCIDI